jgi:hypothetical protein
MVQDSIRDTVTKTKTVQVIQRTYDVGAEENLPQAETNAAISAASFSVVKGIQMASGAWEVALQSERQVVECVTCISSWSKACRC